MSQPIFRTTLSGVLLASSTASILFRAVSKNDDDEQLFEDQMLHYFTYIGTFWAEKSLRVTGSVQVLFETTIPRQELMEVDLSMLRAQPCEYVRD